MRIRLAVATSLLMLISSTAYANTIEIGQSKVKTIELVQKKSNARIIALSNGSAEIVAALGLRSALVGRDIASTTENLKSVPIVTSGHQVLAEKIIALKPTIVLIDKNVGPKSAIDQIKSAKIKIAYVNEAWNLSDIFIKIKSIGVAVGELSQAETLIHQMKKDIAHSKSSLGWKPKVVFLYLRGPSAIYLIGGPGSGADSLISALGGVDVGAKDLKNPFNPLTSEALVSLNPDVILVMSKGLQSVGGVAGLLKLPGVAQTKAGVKEKILSVDDSLLLSFGPRTPSLLVQMSIALRSMK